MEGRPIVVGAGAAGLAVAAALERRGIKSDVLERAPAVGSAWSGRYDSLRLHTVRRLSGIPGFEIPRAYGRWVARDDVVRYLSEYAIRAGVLPEFGVEVTRVDREGDQWRVETSAGARRSQVVVFATGFSSRPFLPEWAEQATQQRLPLVHSSQYRNPTAYHGHRVLVVGAGNSGAEIAVDLARAGVGVTMSVRTPPNIVRREAWGVPSQLLGIALRRVPERAMNPLSSILRRLTVPDLAAQGLPAPSGPMFTQFLTTGTVPILDHGFVQEVREGRIQIVSAVRSVSAAQVHLVDGSTLRPDAIVCATGYRPGLEAMLGHLGVLDEQGVPHIHGAHVLPSAPGLYFAGITIQLAGLLREIGFEADAIGRAIAQTSDPGQVSRA